MTEKYNGWTNYETWRIQLEVIDGMTLEDFGFDIRNMDNEAYSDNERLAENVEQYVDEIVLGNVPNCIARDLAESFLGNVDWFEIAEHLIADAR